jgi:hypothetical protein
LEYEDLEASMMLLTYIFESEPTLQTIYCSSNGRLIELWSGATLLNNAPLVMGRWDANLDMRSASARSSSQGEL